METTNKNHLHSPILFNKKNKNKLIILSGIFIIMSTIGIISINFFNYEITKRERKIDFYRDLCTESLKQVYEAQENTRYVHILQNTLYILEALGKKEKVRKMNNEEIKPIMRKGAYAAINAAELSQKINEKQAQEYMQRVESAQIDSVIKSIYFNNIDYAIEGQNTINGAIEVHANKIHEIEAWRNRILLISIIFQILGLYLGIVLNIIDKQKNIK